MFVLSMFGDRQTEGQLVSGTPPRPWETKEATSLCSHSSVASKPSQTPSASPPSHGLREEC